MVTYSYERQDIIQFALKDYQEADSAVKKLSDLYMLLMNWWKIYLYSMNVLQGE
jgi:hypothetical protein